MTEINDYLKLLWPRIAKAFCPSCGREIRPETAKSIADEVFALVARASSPVKNRRQDADATTVLITFWVSVPAKTEPQRFFEFLQQQGYLRVWIDNEVVRVDDDPKKINERGIGILPMGHGLEAHATKIKRLGSRVQVIQDRIEIADKNRARLVEALETALRFGKGKVNVISISENAQ